MSNPVKWLGLTREQIARREQLDRKRDGKKRMLSEDERIDLRRLAELLRKLTDGHDDLTWGEVCELRELGRYQAPRVIELYWEGWNS